jgi:glyoxylase-like metal-dependent hydrolase (beta-lactamase superfamily II)
VTNLTFVCDRCAFVVGLAGFAALPSAAAARTGDPQALELAVPHMERISDTVRLARVTENVWIHTTTHVLDGVGYYPANGAIVRGPYGAFLIDTCWNPQQTHEVLEAWRRTSFADVTGALVTHFHGDRLGGLAALRERGIPAYAHPRTIALAGSHGVGLRPLHGLHSGTRTLGSVEVFYPGEGHTADNVVAWIPADRVLFGGCLVKSITAPDLGYVADANIPVWPATIRRVARAYAPRHVVPGHGTIAGDPIAHTTSLADASAANRLAPGRR